MNGSGADTRCQRWRNGLDSWRPTSEGGFDPGRYRVVPIAETTARPFVERHHYSRSYPAARLAFGLLDTEGDDRDVLTRGCALVGAAVLSVPMSTRVLTGVFPTLTPFEESLELGRFVLLDRVPANAETWFLARVRRAAADTGVRGLVAFSDPVARHRADGVIVTPGHHGLIYAASNALYLGRATPRTLVYLPRSGVVVSARTLQKIRAGERGSAAAEERLVALGAVPRRPGQDGAEWLRDALLSLGAVRCRHHGNHRYAWALGRPADRRRLPIGLPTGARPHGIDPEVLAA